MNAKNQIDFLRTQKEMGLSEGAVLAQLIQMFVEEPTRFTQEFGLESAEAIREFLGFTTQGDMEKKGYVFDDNSAEIIGQDISFRPPEDSALGTLQTNQANRFDETLDFIKKQLALDPRFPVAEQDIIREEALKDRLNTQALLERLQLQDQATGERFDETLDFIKEKVNIKQKPEEDIKVKIKQKPDPDKKRAQEIEARFTYTTDDNGMVWMTDTVTGETQPAGTEEDRLPRLQTHDNIDMFRKIFRDLIRSGKETGSGIVNAIKEELKNMYKDYTEKSPDYNPELIEKEKVEDYFPPQP